MSLLAERVSVPHATSRSLGLNVNNRIALRFKELPASFFFLDSDLPTFVGSRVQEKGHTGVQQAGFGIYCGAVSL
jgi:hypothetical protein